MTGNERALSAWAILIDVGRVMKREFDQGLHNFGISYVEFKILSLLEHRGPMTMVNIADELIMTKAGVTLLTDRLEERKLVARARKEGDRRLIYVATTASGRELFKRANGHYLKMVKTKFDVLSDDDITRLIAVMEKMSAAVKTEDSPATVLADSSRTH
jgi:MarR family 2-MHQ and catechol resistance regulon transcriptional repressor